MKEPSLRELFRYLRNIFLTFTGGAFLLYLAYTLHTKPFVMEPWSKPFIEITVDQTVFKLDTHLLATSERDTLHKEHTLKDFVSWIGFGYHAPIRHINQTYLEQRITSWEKELRLPVPHEGTLILEKETIEDLPPQNGTRIDSKLLARTLETLAKLPEEKRVYSIRAELVETEPYTSKKEWDDFVSRVRFFLEHDIALVSKQPVITQTLTPYERFHIIAISWNKETKQHEITVFEPLLRDILEPYNRPPQNAEFIVEEKYFVAISPSQTGLAVDIEHTKTSLLKAIENKEQEVELFLFQSNPEITEQNLESLNITHMVSSFTTYFSCCESRAQNIIHVASLLDGVVVAPGETWNLNTFIGKRTEERGFLPAGTLVKGTLIETTGGGISQFATTFYNTLYWGGFQDVSHTPHSRYFSRYPEGIEATISWPEPHLIFKNNTEHGILIKTKTTETSLTVQFFGNNDGRIVEGKHRDGNTILTVVNEGGEDARVVSSLVDNKTEIYPPKEVYYVDPLVEANAIFTKTQGRPSYSVDVTRTIEDKQGKILETKKWKTFYLSEDKEYLVRDCSVAPENALCKTKEDIEREKEELLIFFEELESNLQ